MKRVYGIRDNLLKWFESFLIGRTQSVICDGGQSKSSKVTFGVPAGYSSRPVIVFIVCKRLASEFADDALLYGIISNEDDCNSLQDDLLELERWQDRWQMKFNPSKCEIILIYTKRSPPLK